MSTRNSQLLAHLFEIQPEAVKLFHFVKTWLKVHNFSPFKGYTLTLLVVFYLQSEGLMPPIETVNRFAEKESIDGMKTLTEVKVI